MVVVVVVAVAVEVVVAIPVVAAAVGLVSGSEAVVVVPCASPLPLVVGHAPSPGVQSAGPRHALPRLLVGVRTA